jgi:hypothetical protein
LMEAGGLPSVAGFGNVTALAVSLGCDFADLCALPGFTCDALEAQLRQNETGTDALCYLAYDVLVISFDTAVSLCSNSTNCTAWMYDEAIDAAMDLIDAVGCSLPCATESCGNLTTPTDDTPASQREALCHFLFFDVEVRQPFSSPTPPPTFFLWRSLIF